MEWTHEGVIITVTNEGYFTVQHGDVDKFTGELEVTNYPSLRTAREDIDNKIATARKSKQSMVNVTVLDEQGHTMTLRRIHEGNGDWLTGKGEQDQPKSAYLNMDAPKDLLLQREELREQMRQIDESLRPYSFSLPKGYGKMDPEKIDRIVSQLHERMAIAMAKVNALAEPAQVG